MRYFNDTPAFLIDGMCNDPGYDQPSGGGAGLPDLGTAVVGSGVEYREPGRKARQRFHGIGGTSETPVVVMPERQRILRVASGQSGDILLQPSMF